MFRLKCCQSNGDVVSLRETSLSRRPEAMYLLDKMQGQGFLPDAFSSAFANHAAWTSS